MTRRHRRAPLVTKGSPQAHALSVAARVNGLERVIARARRRIDAEYGREVDPMVVLLVDRLERRLEDLSTTADALLDHLMLHSPAPRSDAHGARLCLNPGCRRPLYGMRSTAKCCSNVCRAAVSDMRREGYVEGLDENGSLAMLLPDETGNAGNGSSPGS